MSMYDGSSSTSDGSELRFSDGGLWTPNGADVTTIGLSVMTPPGGEPPVIITTGLPSTPGASCSCVSRWESTLTLSRLPGTAANAVVATNKHQIALLVTVLSTMVQTVVAR